MAATAKMFLASLDLPGEVLTSSSFGMGTIDSIRSVLTQSALDALCEKYYIPDVVHPELPAPNSRIRHGPVGKIGIYSRFFDAANYPIPLSQFFVNILAYFWINLSQLSVIGAAKVSHFEMLCRVYGFEPTIEMDLFAFIHYADPTKVKIRERQVGEGDVPLLELTAGRVVPLADVNVQGNQGDDVQGNQDADVQVNQDAEFQGEDIDIEGDADVAAPNDKVQVVAVDRPKRFRKRKTADGASGSDHPPKRLRGDHNASGSVGASTGGKSLAVIQELLEQSTLNAKVGVTAAATMPFVTSSVTPTLEHEGGGHTDSVTGPKLRTHKPRDRFVISYDSTSASNTNVVDDEVTSIVRQVRASAFADPASPPAAGADTAGLSQPANSELSSGSFFVAQDMDPRTLEQIYIPKWDVINDSDLEDPEACRSFVDHLAPPGFFSLLRGMDYERLHNLEERCSLQEGKLKDKDVEIANLKAELALRGAEAAEAIHLRGQITSVEAVEAVKVSELNDLKARNAALEEQVAALKSVAVNKDAELLLLTPMCFPWSLPESTCSDLRDEVAGYQLFKEQSPGYLAALRAAIGRAVDKGMQDGLKAGVDHGKAGRGLDIIAAYDPSAEASYVSAVAALRAMKFPLLESQKDASMTDIFDLLRLEGPAAEILEFSQLQPSFEQLMVPIHRLEDQVVVGEVPLPSALEMAHSHVQKLKGDVAACRLSLTDVIVPLV
ncbi:hypothetical protein Tco_0400772 [Tanacetum coccineum]